MARRHTGKQYQSLKPIGIHPPILLEKQSGYISTPRNALAKIKNFYDKIIIYCLGFVKILGMDVIHQRIFVRLPLLGNPARQSVPRRAG